jgi:hypothetical protein
MFADATVGSDYFSAVDFPDLTDLEFLRMHW